VSPCLIQLHWLPLHYRITYKLCTLMHNVHIGKSPRYLADIVQPTSSRATCSGLSSLSETDSYTTPRLHTKFGEWAVSFSGPASWNSLLAELRTITDTSVFKNKLKTYLYKLAFNILQPSNLCFMHPRLFYVGFINFYCSAPMFLR